MRKVKAKATTAPSDNGEAPGRKPDYNVWAVDKKTGISGDIGAAWINEDGTVRIKLNPFVVIDTGVGAFMIKMYPTK